MPSSTGPTRRRVTAVLLAFGAVIAGSAAVYATQDSPSAVVAAPTAAEEPSGTGRVETCVLDANSGCTQAHHFSQKPSSIVAMGAGSSILSIDPSLTTDKTYRLKVVRPDGSRYPAGRSVRFSVHYDFGTDAPAPPPTVTPSSTPPASTAPTKPTATPSTTTPTHHHAEHHHPQHHSTEQHTDAHDHDEPGQELHQPVLHHDLDQQPG